MVNSTSVDDLMYEKLINLISNETDAREDRNGNTPLTSFAQIMKSFGPNSAEKKSLMWALGIIFTNIYAMNHEQIFLLSIFLYTANIDKEEIDKYISYLKSALNRLKQANRVAERAEVMRLISRYTKHKFNMVELKKEKTIETQMPWHWIDIAIDSGFWVPALQKVKTELRNKGGVV